MDLLLILTYAAICIAIFKIFKIPLNKWSVPTAVLGGIVLIGALILFMNYNHPYSEIARQYFVTTPIVPNVTGQVVEVPVKGNQPLEKDDVLFKLDPVPFENKVFLAVRPTQGRLQLADKTWNFLEIHPVVRANMGPPASLHFFKGVGDPAIPEQDH